MATYAVSYRNEQGEWCPMGVVNSVDNTIRLPFMPEGTMFRITKGEDSASDALTGANYRGELSSLPSRFRKSQSNSGKGHKAHKAFARRIGGGW